MGKETIKITEAARWLVRMAAADGVISANERKLIKEFADTYGIENVGKLIRTAYATTNDVEIPEVCEITPSEYKGRAFEDFVVSLCSNRTIFKLQNWRSDKKVGNTYAAENLNPDLFLRHHLESGVVEYLVECKYRSKWGEGIDLSKCYSRYRKIAEEEGKELFVALGVGGNPSDPDEFFLIPDRMVKQNMVFDPERFKKCRCGKTAEAFHAYIQHYFNKRVFKKR